ncbi:hypothetical protein QR680_004153 [Steinernema hermaphroditum]|uniref:Uncharacterized protein n=1 Tax=Steinernema hermaphroditum TaxID=289476 RepID=A0AA39HNW1_9BILA|nr:hypothetical protein QR680_004153 [Steinernema hermaphroditum]
MYPFPNTGTVVHVYPTRKIIESIADEMAFRSESDAMSSGYLQWGVDSSRCPACNYILPISLTITDQKPQGTSRVLCHQCKEWTETKMMFHCRDCGPKTYLCPHCLIREHNGHNIESLSFIRRKKRKQLVNEFRLNSLSPVELFGPLGYIKGNVDSSFAKIQNILNDVVEDSTQTELDILAKLEKAMIIADTLRAVYKKLEEARIMLENFIETSNSQNKDTLSKCSTCNEDVDKKHVYSCTTCGAEENICPHCIIANHPGHAVQQRYVSKDCLKKIIAEVGLTEQICGNESESYLKTFENAQKKIQDVVTQLKRRELLTEKEARDKLDEIKPHVELIKKAQNMAQVFEAQLTNVNAHVD